MSQPSRLPQPATASHAGHHLVLIAVVSVLYAGLLLGTSAIIANPGHAGIESLAGELPELLSDAAPRPETNWPTETTRLEAAAH